MKNLTKLAYQGSIKAIMQLLNNQLQEIGVQTKVALGSEGMLEILCEADHPENLAKETVIHCIEQSLNYLSPRPFRAVHIQSCLTNDAQSLWVSTLSGQARQSLLWSVELEISPLPWRQQMLRSWGFGLSPLPDVEMPSREQMTFSALTSLAKAPPTFPTPPALRSPQTLSLPSPSAPHLTLILGAIAAGLCGWIAHDWWQLRFQGSVVPVQTSTENIENSAHTLPEIPQTPYEDPFSQAVRLANQATTAGQTATTYGEWLELAHRWQQASALMTIVTTDHPRYREAQDRVLSYRQNSEVALTQAKALAPTP